VKNTSSRSAPDAARQNRYFHPIEFFFVYNQLKNNDFEKTYDFSSQRIGAVAENVCVG